jgi:hypothetical protein
MARLLHNIELVRLASDKHSNVLGLFLCDEENEVFCMRPLTYLPGDKKVERH